MRYAYLWHREATRGQEEGSKDRPCAVILSLTTQPGTQDVAVLPITHTPPSDPRDAVEMPGATKRRLGLDDDRSWVVVTEANRFRWPGPDLLPVPGSGAPVYGELPPALFARIRDAFLAAARRQRVAMVRRTE